MENKRTHLEMIQAVIGRMAANSFYLKGWAVTLVAGIFALASKDADKMYFLVTYIPIVVFWGLDAYFLLLERLFRGLYNKVRGLDEPQIDFAMDISPKKFCEYCNCFKSVTELWFYLPLAIVTAGIIIITHI